MSNTDLLTKQDIQVIDQVVEEKRLVIHNDEVNTFDWVIQALVEVCEHSHEQAEQCSLIIHHRGKYAVKHGQLRKLKPLKDAILERGISATIE